MHGGDLCESFLTNKWVPEIGFDIAENEPCKVCPLKVSRCPKCFDTLATFLVMCTFILTLANICAQVQMAPAPAVVQPMEYASPYVQPVQYVQPAESAPLSASLDCNEGPSYHIRILESVDERT